MSDVLAPDDARVKELIERSARLDELTRHPGWADLQAVASESINAYQTRLNSGKLDLDDYRFIAGFLDGARSCLAVPRLVAEQLARLQRDLEVAAEAGESYAPAIFDE